MQFSHDFVFVLMASLTVLAVNQLIMDYMDEASISVRDLKFLLVSFPQLDISL
jgi:hypothetical protein